MTTFNVTNQSPLLSSFPLPSLNPGSSHLSLFFLSLFLSPFVAVLVNIAAQLLLPRDPTLPPTVFHLFPYIGSAITYGTNPLEFFLSCREKYGDVFTFVLFGRRMTVALGPRGSNFILGGKLSQVSAEEAYTHLITPCFGEDVVYDVPNHIFMEQKKFIKGGLSSTNFRAYVGMIEEEIDGFLDTDPSFGVYQSGDKAAWGSFHCLKTMAELTILTASRTLQGKEVRSSLDKSFADLYHDLDGGFQPINLLFPNLPLPSYWRRDKAQKKMSDFYVGIMQKRQKEDTEHEHDMLSAFATATYKDGRALNQREIAHLMIALLMAGQHTSSATSSWAILHLADRPDIQRALYEEQVAHFSKSDGSLRPLTYEELKDLPLLDSVIRETLRMHPPIHSMFRKVMSDIPVPSSLTGGTMSQYVIPKGHLLLASPFVSQMDPLVWKEPAKWDPLRWSDSSSPAAQALNDERDGEKVDYGFGAISKGTDSPYLPFGAGRHRCIGEQFAYLQLGTILATLVRRIQFRLKDSVPEHNYQTMIVVPKGPCTIEYRRR